MCTARPFIMPLLRNMLPDAGCDDQDRRIHCAEVKERSGHYAEREKRTAGVNAGILVSEANKKSSLTLFRPAGNIARSAPAECGKRAGTGGCS